MLVVTGPSGVGKGTLIRSICREFPDLRLSVSATTRPPRSGEKDGVDYHFLSPEEFQRRVDAGEFLEHATYAGNRYGTLRSETEDDPVVLEIEVQGARQVREAMPEAVQVFIAPPSTDVLRERLVTRGTDSPETIRARLQVAEQELRAKDEFPHVIVNDDLERAVRELTDLVATMWRP
ncbi:MAG: guanylate kinase [Actinomycetota bacterium]|nr:guanylate kinase [Actinomycetota bacterium]